MLKLPLSRSMSQPLRALLSSLFLRKRVQLGVLVYILTQKLSVMASLTASVWLLGTAIWARLSLPPKKAAARPVPVGVSLVNATWDSTVPSLPKPERSEASSPSKVQ